MNLEDLKKVGRPAVLMCFVPAALEMLGTIFLAPTLLGVSLLDAAVMGSVIAAVLSILLTAPFGAICIDRSYQLLLRK